MHRRSFLAMGAGTVAATAGCSGVLSGGDSSGGSDTPRITGVGAVTEWAQPGDFEFYRADEISMGDVSMGTFDIAFQYVLDVQGGEVEIRSDVTLYHETQGRIAERQRTDELLSSESGESGFEWSTPFSASVLVPGEITAEVYLRDELSSETAGPVETTFTAVR